MIILFVFYVDPISVATTVVEITCYRFVFAERIWGWILEKYILYPVELLENSWNLVIINQ